MRFHRSFFDICDVELKAVVEKNFTLVNERSEILFVLIETVLMRVLEYQFEQDTLRVCRLLSLNLKSFLASELLVLLDAVKPTHCYGLVLLVSEAF